MNDEPIQPDSVVTEEWPTLHGDVETNALLDDLPFDDAADEWAAIGPARGIRLRVHVLVALALILVAAGFGGGALLQKSHASSTSSNAVAAGLAARFGAGGARPGGATGGTATGGGAATGFGGGAAAQGTAATPGTTGTVSVVDGNTLYVLTATGSLVKVTLDPSTSITRTATTQQDGLRPGDSVVVQGTSASNGDVSATTVSATAKGVSSTAGGGGRGFGLGGGQAPAASTG